MGHALSHDSPSQAQSSSIPRRSRKASTNRPHGAKRVLGRWAGRRETDAVFETRAIHHLHRRTPHKAGRSRPDASGGGRQRRNPGEVLDFGTHLAHTRIYRMWFHRFSLMPTFWRHMTAAMWRRHG